MRVFKCSAPEISLIMLDHWVKLVHDRLKENSLTNCEAGRLVIGTRQLTRTRPQYYKWLDPTVTAASLQQFWQIEEYVNGEFRQLWGPYDSEMEAERAVNRLLAYFNQREMA